MIGQPMFTSTHHHHDIRFLLLLILLFHHPFSATSQQPADEIKPLLQFKSLLNDPTSSLSNWNVTKPPCKPLTKKRRTRAGNWVGIICNSGSVWGLQLENMSLSGTIDMDSLSLLPGLRSISVTSNEFSGQLPVFSKLGALKSLFLSGNNFSGVIDDGAFAEMGVLKKIYMVNNRFSGPIPASLAGLPKLLELGIEENSFEGQIPEFASTDLRYINLSYNKLSGRIPDGLNEFNSTSFQGNPDLCGVPVGIPCRASSSTSFTPIVIIITIILVILITIAFVIHRWRTSRQYSSTTSHHHHQPRHLPQEKTHKPSPNIDPNGYYTYPNGTHHDNNNDHGSSSTSSSYNNNHHTPPDSATISSRSLDRANSYKKTDNGKLCFLRNDTEKFEMQDLLKASAEVLGSGSFGSSYKAALPGGGVMVVKRFRQMNNVGREEFQEHMKRLGRLRHQNLLPVVAYFHKRDEKLLITEYVENGSLASHLHSNITPGQHGLSWPIRLRIIKGVSRALAYLYRELSSQQPLPHGHLKSSNVLLDDTYEPLLSDYSLSPLINKDHAEQVMVAYKSPEFTMGNSTTKKTDVWCLGILILEILTGKFPANYLKHGKGVSDDLATWVNSVVKEDWSGGELFDGEMKGTKNAEGEMVKLLKIGMWCCEWNEEKRWGLREAVEKIEELKERDGDEDDKRFPSSGNVVGNDDEEDEEDDEEEEYVSGSDSSSVAIRGEDRLSFR